MIQALLALAKDPSSASYQKGTSNPVSVLVSFQLTSGSGKGAFFFPGSSTPNLLASYQAVPAVAAVKFPFNLSITTSALHRGSVGVAYSATVTAQGGHGAYSWIVMNGSLPAGLTLKRNSGVISGKPTRAGKSTFTVEVKDTKVSTVPHSQDIAWKVLSIST